MTSTNHNFDWSLRDKRVIRFHYEVNYSNHCYSDAGLQKAVGSYMVADHHGVERVFCPTRHRTSLDLPAIIDGLIAKPTTSVGVCFETPNYNVFRTTVDKDYFYVFFHVKTIASGAASYRMRLFVESAYSKAKAVPTRRKIPFGMLSEYVATSRKF